MYFAGTIYSDDIMLQYSPGGKNEVIELDARSVERRLNAARGLFTFYTVKPLSFK